MKYLPVKKRYSVNVVDDSEVEALALKHVFDDLPHDIHMRYHNGGAGLDEFLSERPDIFILDMHIPSYDVWDSVRTIRQHNQDSIIIIYSGVDPALQREAIRTSYQDEFISEVRYLTKPSNEELGRRIWDKEFSCLIKGDSDAA
ncbi:MAG: hypothetical protein CMM93_02400 [Rickettsiales bacterium]|nr:hypothetical protein [Rickettsiales bacterium]|tara:strand:- start:3433 stop:3864 length:432 start_codon:yes stop_codon:yes gene_type:complete